MIRQVSLVGTAMHTYSELVSAVRFFSNAKLRPVISKVFSLEDSLQGVEHLESGSHFGKIAIHMD
jgi:D-arabinose 1-dehydrogenase-like Zn-dependent alcohol dehydrogenase